MSTLDSTFPFIETRTVDDRLALIKESLVETAYETEEELDAFLVNLRASIEAEAVAALAAERDRLREALERIADTYDANDECRWCGTEIDMDHYEDCASVLARAALAPGTPVDVE